MCGPLVFKCALAQTCDQRASHIIFNFQIYVSITLITLLLHSSYAVDASSSSSPSSPSRGLVAHFQALDIERFGGAHSHSPSPPHVFTPLASPRMFYMSLSGVDSVECGSSAGAACRTLSAALARANDGDQINIHTGTYECNANTIIIDRSIIITTYGGAVTFDCRLRVDDRVFHFVNVDVTLSGVTIANGNVQGAVLIQLEQPYNKRVILRDIIFQSCTGTALFIQHTNSTFNNSIQLHHCLLMDNELNGEGAAAITITYAGNFHEGNVISLSQVLLNRNFASSPSAVRPLSVVPLAGAVSIQYSGERMEHNTVSMYDCDCDDNQVTDVRGGLASSTIAISYYATSNIFNRTTTVLNNTASLLYTFIRDGKSGTRSASAIASGGLSLSYYSASSIGSSFIVGNRLDLTNSSFNGHSGGGVSVCVRANAINSTVTANNIVLNGVSASNNVAGPDHGGAVDIAFTITPAAIDSSQINQIKIIACEFSSNSAIQGAALRISSQGFNGSEPVLMLLDSSLKLNQAGSPNAINMWSVGAGRGAAAYLISIVATITASQFLSNYASYSAGAVYLAGSSTALFNRCTLRSNVADVRDRIVTNEGSGRVEFRQTLIDMESEAVASTLGITVLNPLYTNYTQIQCPGGSTVYSNQYSVGCILCDKNTYSIARSVWINNKGTSSCLVCPVPGGDCSQGGSEVVSTVGFWGLLLPDNQVQFTQCPYSYCCSHENAVDGKCSSYHACRTHRKGVLCSECEQGYNEALGSSACVDSSKCIDAAWFVPLCLSIGLILAICFILNSSSSSSTGALSILAYFYQMAAFMLLIQNGTANIFNTVSIVLIQVWQIQPTGSPESNGICIPGLTSVGRELFFLLVPLFIFLPFILLIFTVLVYQYLMSSWNHHPSPFPCTNILRRSSSLSKQVLVVLHAPLRPTISSGLWQIIMYSYAIVMSRLVNLIHCVPINGMSGSYIYLAASVQCYQSWQYALISAVVVLSLLPLLLCWYLWSTHSAASNSGMLHSTPAQRPSLPSQIHDSPDMHSSPSPLIIPQQQQDRDNTQLIQSPHHMHDAHKKAHWQHALITPFQSRFAYWESILLIHRLSVVFIGTLVDQSMVRVIILSFFNVFMLTLNSFIHPYRSNFAHNLQHTCMSLLVLLCTFSFFAAGLNNNAGIVTSSVSEVLSVCSILQLLCVALPIFYVIGNRVCYSYISSSDSVSKPQSIFNSSKPTDSPMAPFSSMNSTVQLDSPEPLLSPFPSTSPLPPFKLNSNKPPIEKQMLSTNQFQSSLLNHHFEDVAHSDSSAAIPSALQLRSIQLQPMSAVDSNETFELKLSDNLITDELALQNHLKASSHRKPRSKKSTPLTTGRTLALSTDHAIDDQSSNTHHINSTPAAGNASSASVSKHKRLTRLLPPPIIPLGAAALAPPHSQRDSQEHSNSIMSAPTTPANNERTIMTSLSPAQQTSRKNRSFLISKQANSLPDDTLPLPFHIVPAPFTRNFHTMPLPSSAHHSHSTTSPLTPTSSHSSDIFPRHSSSDHSTHPFQS